MFIKHKELTRPLRVSPAVQFHDNKTVSVSVTHFKPNLGLV